MGRDHAERRDAAALVPMVVLVVENEPLVRMVAVDMLEDEGFAVIEAANADEGLGQLRARLDVQVLFTDVHMPGLLDGLALARRAAASHPHVAVLIASGKATPHPSEMPAGARFLAKPHLGHTVIEHIRAVSNAA